MQISLSPNADQLSQRLIAHSYSDPATIVEVALERMEQTTLAALNKTTEKSSPSPSTPGALFNLTKPTNFDHAFLLSQRFQNLHNLG
jgi:hypothetical protein